MRPPAFWQVTPPTWAACALWPISAVWGLIAGRRMGQPGTRVGVPVICIGNFTIGGAGKTPTALAVASLMQAQGHHPAFVSRGYGGTLGAPPTQVDPTRHTARDVGDEPLMLAAQAPTFVARDRVAGAQAAMALGASHIILDDGLQNPGLHKSLSLAVVDGLRGIGNGLCLPAGPLRAPLSIQWQHVAGVLVLGAGKAGDDVAQQAQTRGLPVFCGRVQPADEASNALKGQKVVAFAGIAHPQKFYSTLQALGAQIIATRDFADHAPIAEASLLDLAETARRDEAILVTTQKDMVRIGPEAWAALACPRMVVPVTLTWDDADGFYRLLRQVL